MKHLVDKRMFDRIRETYDRIELGPKTEVEWLGYNMCAEDMSYGRKQCWCRYHLGSTPRLLCLTTRTNANGTTSYFVEPSH